MTHRRRGLARAALALVILIATVAAGVPARADDGVWATGHVPSAAPGPSNPVAPDVTRGSPAAVNTKPTATDNTNVTTWLPAAADIAHAIAI